MSKTPNPEIQLLNQPFIMFRFKCLLATGLFGLLWATTAFAQPSAVHTDPYESLKYADQLFNNGIYAAAQSQYEKTVNLSIPANSTQFLTYKKKAELGYAKCAVRQELPNGERLIEDFIRTYSPDPIAKDALLELADFYFNKKEYEKALKYFNSTSSINFGREKQAEIDFKMGYSYLVKKNLELAARTFSRSIDVESDYQFDIIYYYGICQFRLGDYKKANANFKKVEKSTKYKSHVPINIAQIYFAEGDYRKVIEYGEPKLNVKKIRNRKKICQLVGCSYFELGDYEKALPLLEVYEEGSSKLPPEDFYRLGYVYFQTGNYEKAAQKFGELNNEQSELGQYAQFYSGISYLKLKNKQKARIAFGKAKDLNFDEEIASESNFNFAKLSFELGRNREALAVLITIPKSSPFYNESQNIMSEIFLRDKNYGNSIQTMERIRPLSPQLRETYQKINYLYGLQLYKEGNYAQAEKRLVKAQSDAVSQKTKAEALFWLAQLSYKADSPAQAIKYLNSYFALGNVLKQLNESASVYVANYSMGYNYLKTGNYSQAKKYFEKASTTIENNRSFIQSRYIKDNILGDSYLRTADCYFKLNSYSKANKYYDKAIQKRAKDFVYALYQKAQIQGLLGNTTDKILLLEEIFTDYPKSQYADDAMFALAETYQEIDNKQMAMKTLRQLVEDYGTKSEWIKSTYLKMGLIAFNQGNMNNSAEYYKAVFRLNPSKDETLIAKDALKEIYIDNKGDARAYNEFIKSIPGMDIDNNIEEENFYLVAKAKYDNAQWNDAIDKYTFYLSNYPKGFRASKARYERAEAYYSSKQYDEAYADLTEIIAENQEIYMERALELCLLISYDNNEDFGAAFRHAEQLNQVTLNNYLKTLAQRYGLVAAYKTNNTQGVADMARQLKNNPDAESRYKIKAQHYLGKLAYENGDHGTALQAFQEVVDAPGAEDASEAMYLIAEMYFKDKKYDNAEAMIQNIFDNSADYYYIEKALLLTADISISRADYYNAEGALQAIISNYVAGENDEDNYQAAKEKLMLVQQKIKENNRVESANDDMQFDNGDGGE
jgi:tetratricopeptide (TPR) repeat protein